MNQTWNQVSHYASTLQPYFNTAIVHFHTYQHIAQKKVIQHWPQFQHFNRFQIFLLLNAFIIGLFIILRILPYFNPFYIYKSVFGFVLKLPFVTNKIRLQLEKQKQKTIDQIPKKYRSQLKKIPYQVVEANFGDQCEKNSLKGYLSGSRYVQKKHSEFVVDLAKQFSYSNPLHFDLHPHVKQMEVQVIKMCAKMMNFYSQKNEAIGGFFSGGTQSILMAILACRQYGFKYRGVKNPNLVICTTGHAAALKAACVFGLQVRMVKTDKDQMMDVSDTKSKIDCNTVCVYTSFPNYPYGTVDPIEDIAKICKKKGVPVHIDMCLGGFLVPFLKGKNGTPYFVVPDGVTSISMDCHKYGLSAKGASVLLFKSQKLRKMQLFVTTDWPGGLYGTPGIAGSRSGTNVASAWISMMRLGVKGLTKNANLVQNAVRTLASQLRALGFKIFGNPQICCIGFNHPKYPVGMIKELIKAKGWDVPILQRPMALHYSFTPLNATKIDQFVTDFRQIMPELERIRKENKSMHKNAQLQLYGACSKIPDNSFKGELMNMVLDMYLDV